ncbi:HNH endonuclease signature motif containing protein [Paracoccaceae bacterium Fryx2]|nr:HNH endonuclease signature motif containing protein [Paracoccaceae bacterium Fryx2]
MSGKNNWDWSDLKRHRRLLTVEDHIFWAYSMLTVCRQLEKCATAGKPNPYPGGRTKATNIIMSKYQQKTLNISTLDRDDALAQDGTPVCAHCGSTSPVYHWDHLIPRSKLNGKYIALNQVRSCPHCNTSRGDKDLMVWHRQRMTFPSLAVLRRYLKLCYFYAEQHNQLNQAVDSSVARELPFDPTNLPRRFPPVGMLVWDFSYPEHLR